MIHQSRKTSQPFLPSTVLFRETLIRKLGDALIPSSDRQSVRYKLALLRAPAGYGKTTLLADFARRSQHPVGWYFLDHSDAHLPVFLETFTAILYQEFPATRQEFSPSFFEELLLAIQSEDQQQSFALLDMYVSTVEKLLSHPFIICLCDYHRINKDSAIQFFLNYFLKKMPDNLSIVIESRAIPMLELAPLLARRQLLGLGSDVLRFSTQEVREFSALQQGFPVTEEEAKQLTDIFDGWIAGMLVATHLGNIHASYVPSHSERTRNLTDLSIDWKMLFSYVKDEIFEKELQAFTFLQETSLLQSMTASQCNDLLQSQNAEEYLTYIERQGLFITRVGNQDAQPVYVLAPVLRQLFYDTLCHSQNAYATALHQRAAHLYFAQGDYEQAITYALKVQDYAVAENIIIKATQAKKGQQIEQEKIAYWIEMLPDTLYEQQPQLLLIRAKAYLSKHEHVHAAALLEKAYQLVTRPSFLLATSVTPTLRAEITIAWSIVFFQKGNYIRVEQLCNEALEHLSADETELRILALIRLGICKTLSGAYTDAITQLQQALQLSGYHMATEQVGYIHTCLANTYNIVCNYALSEHHRERAIAIYEQLNDVQGKIKNLIWMAMLKRNKGELDQAEAMLKDIITQARQENLHSEEAYSFFNLGANYIDKGCLREALVALEKSLSLAYQIEDDRLAGQCLCELAMTYLFMDDVHMALLLLGQTTVVSAEKVSYETPAYELARNTILLHQRDFEQAASGFHALESLAERMKLKRTQIECLIRLAACQQALSLFTEMEASMKKVVHLVAQGYFEHIPLIELQRSPDLWQAIQRLPEQACLDSWRISLDDSSQDKPVGSEKATSASAEDPPQIEYPHTEGLRILAFGEPTVVINGVPVTHWHMALAMELYFFLLDYGRPIRKEQLVEIFWPDDKEYIDQTLRSAIHYLRKAIGKSCISFQAGTYTLNQGALYGDAIWYDVGLFQRYAVSAREALEAGQDELAKEHLQAMVDLYRGDYVQSFYSNWCISRRDELRQSYIDARHELARMAWQDRQIEESIQHWQHLLAIDNCLEKAHYGLMRCYVSQGKRSLAARQYQRCVDILQQELSIMPGPVIQKFYHQFLSVERKARDGKKLSVTGAQEELADLF